VLESGNRDAGGHNQTYRSDADGVGQFDKTVIDNTEHSDEREERTSALKDGHVEQLRGNMGFVGIPLCSDRIFTEFLRLTPLVAQELWGAADYLHDKGSLLFTEDRQ
jgi:hypothetical protein